MESQNNPNLQNSNIEKIDLSIQKSNIFESEGSFTKNIKEVKVPVEKIIEAPKKKNNLINNILTGLIVLNIIIVIFLQSQISSVNLFGENANSKKNNLQTELINKKAEITKFNLLISSYSLDNFILNSEDYISHLQEIDSPLSTSSKKEKLKKDLPVLELKIKDSIENIKNASIPISTNENELTQIKKSTKALLNKYKADLSASKDETNKMDIQDEIKNINNVISLIDGASILNSVKSLDTENISEENLSEVLKKIYATQKTNLAIINKLDTTRINWSPIIDEIDIITRKVDPLYGSSLSENIGQISYKTFELEESKGKNASNKIVVTGTIKTPNSVNFNIASNLIDEIEKSKMFQGADMRSFTKKLNNDGTYTGNFNVTFYLEEQSKEPTKK